MKILYYFAQYDSAMYHWQDVHIIDELAHHGVCVEVFNPLHFKTMDEANEQVLKYLNNNRYDLFMTCNTEQYCYIDTVKRITQSGIPTLLICFDSLMTPLAHMKIAPFFDAVMISQKDEKGIFKKYNRNILVSHYAANPFFFTPMDNIGNVPRIAFAGTPYGSRAAIIDAVTKNGVPLDLYFGGSSTLSDSSGDMGKIVFKSKKDGLLRTAFQMLQYTEGRKVLYAAAKDKLYPAPTLNMNTQNLYCSDSINLKQTNFIYATHYLSLSVAIARKTGNLRNPINIVHLRNFEIPMCGGVQICQYFDELAECFEDGKEIIFYGNNDELIEKSKFYLRPENESIRRAIRVNARKRAEAEHTWYCRFSKAFELLGLSIHE